MISEKKYRQKKYKMIVIVIIIIIIIIVIIINISFSKVDFYMTFYNYKKPINVNQKLKV